MPPLISMLGPLVRGPDTFLKNTWTSLPYWRAPQSSSMDAQDLPWSCVRISHIFVPCCLVIDFIVVFFVQFFVVLTVVLTVQIFTGHVGWLLDCPFVRTWEIPEGGKRAG